MTKYKWSYNILKNLNFINYRVIQFHTYHLSKKYQVGQYQVSTKVYSYRVSFLPMRVYSGTFIFESSLSLSNKAALKDSGEGKFF